MRRCGAELAAAREIKVSWRACRKEGEINDPQEDSRNDLLDLMESLFDRTPKRKEDVVDVMEVSIIPRAGEILARLAGDRWIDDPRHLIEFRMESSTISYCNIT
jgi:hypothetical protein